MWRRIFTKIRLSDAFVSHRTADAIVEWLEQSQRSHFQQPQLASKTQKQSGASQSWKIEVSSFAEVRTNATIKNRKKFFGKNMKLSKIVKNNFWPIEKQKLKGSD